MPCHTLLAPQWTSWTLGTGRSIPIQPVVLIWHHRTSIRSPNWRRTLRSALPNWWRSPRGGQPDRLVCDGEVKQFPGIRSLVFLPEAKLRYWPSCPAHKITLFWILSEVLIFCITVFRLNSKKYLKRTELSHFLDSLLRQLQCGVKYRVYLRRPLVSALDVWWPVFMTAFVKTECCTS
jgi:hypothetical protein